MAGAEGGGFGEMLKGLFSGAVQLPVGLAKNALDIPKNPASFLNDKGEVSITRLLFPEYRKEKIAEQQAAQEIAKAEAITKTVANVKNVWGMLSGEATDAGQQAVRMGLEQAGVEVPLEMRQRATLQREKTRQAARASGMSPEVARIADIGSAQAAGQTAFSAQKQQETNTQQAGLTRGNQLNNAILARETASINRTGDIQKAKQVGKINARIGRRGERQEAKPFVDASQKLSAFAKTPEGAAAFEKNPALRGVLGIMDAVGGEGLTPEVAQAMFGAATGAAQKGATAQGTPDQFAPSTKGLVEKDLLAAQDLGMLADRVIATYNPDWSTLAGKTQLAGEKMGDLAGYTPQNLAEFKVWNQGASELYSRNKLELTGQASNAQESREIQRVVPDPDSLGPTQVLSALQSYRANAARKERMLAKIASQGRVELSQPEKDALTLQTLLDLRRQGVVQDFAVKSFFGMMAPARKQAAMAEMQRLAMEAGNAAP